MATLGMHIGDSTAEDAASGPERQANPSGNTPPESPSFWRSRVDRLLSLLSLAIVITVPATGLFVLGTVLDNDALRVTAAIIVAIASVFWFIAYMMVATWLFSRLVSLLKHYLRKISQP